MIKKANGTEGDQGWGITQLTRYRTGCTSVRLAARPTHSHTPMPKYRQFQLLFNYSTKMGDFLALQNALANLHL